MRVDVRPELLTWARERAGLSTEELAKKFARWDEWEAGEVQPTFKQLQQVANATHAPFGFLLLPEPPEETVPLPDFRTFDDAEVRRVSPNLLDTIYLCEQRQEWYRTYVQQEQIDPPPFVGSADLNDVPHDVGGRMRQVLDFEVAGRADLGSWSEALRILSERTETAGVLVMISGVVGSNTHRTLDPAEFRGFALVDPLAPVIFVNGSDTKAAQIFTLAHELAHVWLGGSALGNSTVASTDLPEVERWCNEAAAEFLVPANVLLDDFDNATAVAVQLQALARSYRVSTFVVLRRLLDLQRIDRATFFRLYRHELDLALDRKESGPSGGDFYNTTPVRVSKRFARAVLGSTLEGQTLYRDAYQLLGFKASSTFDGLVEKLGVA